MEYKYTGIILNKREVGETDRIYTLYTLEGGKIRTLAKGVRKPHAKLAASLENITLADVTIMRTKGLGKITGSIVEQNFSSLKKDCDALLETFVGLAVFDKMIDLENADKHVFELLKNYLEAVDECAAKNGNREKYVLLRLGFLTKLLDELGYSMEISACVNCGGQLTSDGLYFSAASGGALCAACAQLNLDSAIPLKVNAIKMLRLFLQNKMPLLAKIQATSKDCDNARLVLDEFLRWNL